MTVMILKIHSYVARSNLGLYIHSCRLLEFESQVHDQPSLDMNLVQTSNYLVSILGPVVIDRSHNHISVVQHADRVIGRGFAYGFLPANSVHGRLWL